MTNPLKIKLNVGSREVKITKTNYLSELITLNVQVGKTATKSISLRLSPKLTYPLSGSVLRGGDILEINGTIPAENLINYKIEYGIGKNPTSWSSIGVNLVDRGKSPITNGKLASLDSSKLIQSNFYKIKLTVYKSGGETVQKDINNIYFDFTLKKGWPYIIEESSEFWEGIIAPVIDDLNNDGKFEVIFFTQGGKLYILDLEGNKIKEIFFAISMICKDFFIACFFLILSNP